MRKGFDRKNNKNCIFFNKSALLSPNIQCFAHNRCFIRITVESPTLYSLLMVRIGVPSVSAETIA